MGMGTILENLFGEGGILRVRAIMALSLTGIGGCYLLVNEAMPPGEFNVLWSAAVAFYFSGRASATR